MQVFRDRAHAGRVLGDLLEGHVPEDGVVLAIPAGGVPVAVVLAARLGLPVDVAVVSKLTLPWNSEVGYGAMAFDGTLVLNHALVGELGLDEATVRRGVEATRKKVRRRVEALGRNAAFRPPAGTAVVVDDGLASGFTLRAVLEALRRGGTSRILVAVPTGSERTVRTLEPLADAIFCANVRSGSSFAVADAYVHWCDVPEAEAATLLAATRPAAE